MPIGQRIHTTARYVKHPPAASDYWADGASVDAGTAHLLHSNLSHLSECNLRHLGTVLGPGLVRGHEVAKPEDPYSVNGILDASPSDPADPLYSVTRIAWLDGYDALCIGPSIAVPVTLQTDPPGYRVRKVRLIVDGAKGAGAGSIYLVGALCLSSAPPSVQPPEEYEISSSYTVAGAFQWDVTLEIAGPARPSREWLCATAGDAVDTTVRAVDLYVRLGWFSTTFTGGYDSIYAVHAFEVL